MKKLAATLAAITCTVGLGVAPAQAQETHINCESNKFAAGGYPLANRVPDGYNLIPSPGGVFPWENGGYNHGQDTGAANGEALIDKFAEACPDAEILVKGHSYGAGVVHILATKLDGKDYADRVRVYLTGNPRHPGGVDDTWQGFTLMPGVTFRGALPVPQNLASFVDVCNPYDAICAMPPWYAPFDVAQAVFGYLFGAHSYPGAPDWGYNN